MVTQKLPLQSRITNQSQYQFRYRSYTATKRRWHSTINMMEKSSTEQRKFQTGTQPCLHDKVLPTSHEPTWRQSTDTHTDKASRYPTGKSQAHLETVCLDTHRQVCEVDHDSTEAAYREPNLEVVLMVTEADFQTRLPSQAVSTSQCRLLMTTGCKIYSPEHAEALHRGQTGLARLNLVSITIFREAHLLYVYE